MSYIHTILTTKPEADYELLDSGNEEKLERYGEVILARPDPQALWQKNKPELWSGAHGIFVRDAQKASWNMKDGTPEQWTISLGGLRFLISPTAFKHTGVFPEQVSNWSWISERISHACQQDSQRTVRVLNLFGYTGGATLAAARAGAHVVHVDGSKSAIGWAKENAAASGLSEKPIRWMLDDVRKFVAREIKRGSVYDGIILDPPAFGHGAKKELWKIEEHLPELLSLCKKIVSDKPLFVVMNGYAAGYSAIAYAHNISAMMASFGGVVEMGELTIEESQSGRLLPCGIFARWYTT